MAADVDKEFARDQKVLVKRAMKGRSLYFGLQAKSARAGKFLLSKKPGEVKPSNVKELQVYRGKDAEKQNSIPGGASMGVVSGASGTLTMFFERGKSLPVAAKYVKYFVTRELQCRIVKRVVISEVNALPAVSEVDDGDNLMATPESIRERAAGLLQRIKGLGIQPGRMGSIIQAAVEGAAQSASASDDLLDEVESQLGTHEWLSAMEKLLTETEQQSGVSLDAVSDIRNKLLNNARKQLDAGQIDAADETLDSAEESIHGLRDKAALRPSSGEVTARNVSAPVLPPPKAGPQTRTILVADPEKLRIWEVRQEELKQTLVSILRQNANAFDAETKKRLSALFEKATQLAKNQHDYRQAGIAHGAIHKILNDVAGSEPTESRQTTEARETIATAASVKAGVVAFAKLRLQLKAAESSYASAAGNLQTACRAMLMTPDFIDDPQASAPETLAAVAKIADRVPPIADIINEVDGALDTMASTTNPAAREKAKSTAVKALSDYRRKLDDEPLLKKMQSTDAGKFPIYDQLADSIDNLLTAING